MLLCRGRAITSLTSTLWRLISHSVYVSVGTAGQVRLQCLLCSQWLWSLYHVYFDKLFKIEDYFVISSQKLKRGWTLTTSQYTITHIVYFQTQRTVTEKYKSYIINKLVIHTTKTMFPLPLQGKYTINVYFVTSCSHCNDYVSVATTGQVRHQRLLCDKLFTLQWLCFRCHDRASTPPTSTLWQVVHITMTMLILPRQGKYAIDVYFVTSCSLYNDCACFAMAGQVRHQRLLCSHWLCVLRHCRASTPSTSAFGYHQRLLCSQ